MPKRTTDFREDLLADLTDPAEASRYLNAALEDSAQMMLVALRDVADSRQMSRVAGQAGVSREALYRMLKEDGNPTYSTLTGIMRALGLKIQIVALGEQGGDRPNIQDAAHAVRPRHVIKTRTSRRRS